MKGFKKLLTGILAATMVFSMGISAAATESTDAPKTSITIDSSNTSVSNPNAVITYDYFQIMKADIVNGDQIAYYVTEEGLAKALAATKLFVYSKSADGSRYNVKLADEKNKPTGEAIAEALNTKAVKDQVKITGEFYSKNGVATQELAPGYYLILSSLGTVAAVQTVGEVKINEKNSYPTIGKEDDKDFAQMYDTVVTYTLDVKVPASVAKKTIKVVDTATVGLTFNKNITATVDGKTVAQYQWSDPVLTEGKNVYTTVIDEDVVAASKGKSIILTYTATVNEKARVCVPEQNTAHLEYDNYASAETDPVDVTTLGVKIVKIDGTNKKALTDAEFSLWDSLEGGNQIAVVKDGNNYRIAKDNEQGQVIAVDSEGKATIVGLDAKTYYLQEDKAPAGYNMLDARQELVINGELQLTEGVQVVEVKNFTGSVLPETGGIGTTVFYLLGGILIIAGVAYFMVRRKADAQA
ncbi:isopeptide-forming domain-containing fimbrial protein [Butyrivibrio sp. MC2021]|uniref:isopeptide-forming domain-containing fimbrial protein n=1 Tax=Butyrivibrio sp. MC2021 TaxID=1408306 RepID=UPI00047AFB7C|nr:isopeptide-forming domain-containing fimbrial protein [Butyrivibrio sp. MC2021]